MTRLYTYSSFSYPAFSLELLLKSIHLELGKAERGHNLKNLFNRLPGKKQNEIKAEFYKRLPSYSKKIPGFLTFEEMLANHAGAFEELRYLHEVGSFSFNNQFCATLAYSITAVAAKMKNDLTTTVLKQQEKGLINLSSNSAQEIIKIPSTPIIEKLHRGFRYPRLSFLEGFRER